MLKDPVKVFIKLEYIFLNYSLLLSKKENGCIYTETVFSWLELFILYRHPNLRRASQLGDNQGTVFLCEVGWVQSVFPIKYYNYRCSRKAQLTSVISTWYTGIKDLSNNLHKNNCFGLVSSLLLTTWTVWERRKRSGMQVIIYIWRVQNLFTSKISNFRVSTEIKGI